MEVPILGMVLVTVAVCVVTIFSARIRWIAYQMERGSINHPTPEMSIPGTIAVKTYAWNYTATGCKATITPTGHDVVVDEMVDFNMECSSKNPWIVNFLCVFHKADHNLFFTMSLPQFTSALLDDTNTPIPSHEELASSLTQTGMNAVEAWVEDETLNIFVGDTDNEPDAPLRYYGLAISADKLREGAQFLRDHVETVYAQILEEELNSLLSQEK